MNLNSDFIARVVQHAASSRFDAHMYPGGGEILVLEGLFQDEAGDYPAGTWLRNPRWSRHTPHSGPEGALIYVKVGAIDAPFMPLPG